MKRILNIIALLLVVVVMMSCGSTETNRQKAYKRLAESPLLAEQPTKVLDGWLFLEKQYPSLTPKCFADYHEVSEAECNDPKHPLNCFNFGGLSIGFYGTNSGGNLAVYNVFFRYGEPLMACEQYEFKKYDPWDFYLKLKSVWQSRTMQNE